MASYKVCVQCMTYNQSQYITDTLNSFCAQKTDFPYVCCVVDDASTDGEQDVIVSYLNDNFNVSDNVSYTKETEYANILFAQHKSNANCFFAVLLLKENYFQNNRTYLKFGFIKEWLSEADYQAICEGDDYWIDPLKLQKQVDRMDADPDCMLCCTDVVVDSVGGGYPAIADYSSNCLVPPSDMIEKGGAWICTCSCLFRTVVFDRFLELDFTRLCHIGDWCWQILSVILGNAYFINEKTACYRYVSAGSWTKKISNIDPLKRLSEIGSITDMLIGLDDFSGRRFHTSFENSLRNYTHVKALLFCKSRNTLKPFKRRCRKAWKYLSLRQRLLLNLYCFGFIERALVYCKKHI